MSIEAMKQAQECLERVLSHGSAVQMAKDVLRQAIDQAEQAQPVAWYDPEVMNEDRGISWTHGQFHTAPLYAAPPERKWVGLTEAERVDIIDIEIPEPNDDHWALAQSIEAMLKEKNT